MLLSIPLDNYAISNYAASEDQAYIFNIAVSAYSREDPSLMEDMYVTDILQHKEPSLHDAGPGNNRSVPVTQGFVTLSDDSGRYRISNSIAYRVILEIPDTPLRARSSDQDLVVNPILRIIVIRSSKVTAHSHPLLHRARYLKSFMDHPHSSPLHFYHVL